MAFEVARVHRLICSNIKDDGNHGLSPVPTSFAKKWDSTTQQTGQDLHFPADLHCDPAAFNQWSEVSGSAVESSSCSTETESDEEDEVSAGLAQQIAHSMLEEEDNAMEMSGVWGGRGFWDARSLHDDDVNKVSISPPSSWSKGSWSSSSWPSGSTASSKGSSRVSSQVSSPPTTPSAAHHDAWDLLYAAAGEVVRLKMNEERNAVPFPISRYQQQQIHDQSLQVPVPFHIRSPGRRMVGRNSPSYSGSPLAPSRLTNSINANEKAAGIASANTRTWNNAVSDGERKLFSNQNRAAKCAPLTAWADQNRLHPMLQQQQQHQQQGCRLGAQKAGQSYFHSRRNADCHPPQWRNASSIGGSGMQAVFLGGGSGRESGGTGVFLPRTAGIAPDPRRKSGCSTVLLPSRIVQVLNLNVEDVCTHSSSGGTPIPSTNRENSAVLPLSPPMLDVMDAPSTGSPKLSNEESWPVSEHKSAPSGMGQPGPPELSLPTEWTY